jgi:hypothetical protein
MAAALQRPADMIQAPRVNTQIRQLTCDSDLSLLSMSRKSRVAIVYVEHHQSTGSEPADQVGQICCSSIAAVCKCRRIRVPCLRAAC